MYFKRILHSQSKTVIFSAIILGISAVISQFLGFFRDRLLASRFGAGQELDVYFAAFRIPDFIFGILIMGGISAIFLPVFSEYFKKSDKEGWELTNNALNIFFVLLILICGVAAAFTPYLVKFITPGFNAEQRLLMISLTRIMFFSPILLGVSSIFSGILHYFDRFLAYSLAPILYNVGIIVGIMFFVPIFGFNGLAYGVILGALLHWLVQLPSAKISGFKYIPAFNFKYPGLVKIFKLMVPRTIGAAAHHINLTVITAIASTMAAGSIVIFNFSNNFRHLPVSLIGPSFALASFPALSRAFVDGIKGKFLENFSSAFRQILFSIIPISVLMFILREQIVRFILGAGQFGEPAIKLTAASLGLFCLGIFASAFVPFLARVFFSFHDTKTPTIAGLIFMAINVALSFLFIWLLRFPNVFQESMIDILKLRGIEDISVVGLPLAMSIAAIVHFFLLLIFLRKKVGQMRLREILGSFQRIMIASLFMGFAIYPMRQFTAGFGVLWQIILVGLAGTITYFAVSYLQKSPELKTIKFSIFGQFSK